MSKMIWLHLACNHWRNGVASGRCSGIALDDSERLTLEQSRGCLKCAIEEGILKLGKRACWFYEGHRTWVGNWCWDAVLVSAETAASVLNFAISRGYRPSVGSKRIWEKVESGVELTAADLTEDEADEPLML